MNIADNPEMVGKSFFAIKGVEISELGVDVEVHQQRYLSVVGGLHEYDPLSVTLVVGLWCGSGHRLYGTRCWTCHRRGYVHGIRCRHRGICRCRRCIWLPANRHIRCRVSVKPSLQTVDLIEQRLLLLLHL